MLAFCIVASPQRTEQAEFDSVMLLHVTECVLTDLLICCLFSGRHCLLLCKHYFVVQLADAAADCFCHHMIWRLRTRMCTTSSASSTTSTWCLWTKRTGGISSSRKSHYIGHLTPPRVRLSAHSLAPQRWSYRLIRKIVTDGVHRCRSIKTFLDGPAAFSTKWVS